mgnify:CR=1 FL=1
MAEVTVMDGATISIKEHKMTDEVARYPKMVQHPTDKEISKDVNNNYGKEVPKMVVVNTPEEEKEIPPAQLPPHTKMNDDEINLLL